MWTNESAFTLPVGVVQPGHDGVRPGPGPGPGGPRGLRHHRAQRVQPGPHTGLVQAAAATEASSHHWQQAADKREFQLLLQDEVRDL